VTLMVVFFTKSDDQMFCRTVKAPTAGSLNRSVARGKWTKGWRRSREGTSSTSIVQPGCTKPGRCSKEEFKQGVERELTGTGNRTLGSYLFQAIQEPAAGGRAGDRDRRLDAGTDKSRGYCLEMICAVFLAGANLENENPEVLLQSALRLFKFLPVEERQIFLHHVNEKAS
jgi:hypothetical protein